MELLTPSVGTLFWTGLTFLILLFILAKTAWGPLLKMLDERETQIRESLEKADAAQRETEAALAKNQEILDEARREAQELLSKSKKTAESAREEMVRRAEAEAAKILDKARNEIAQEREKAVADIKAQAAEISIMIASKLIGKSLSKEDHRELIEGSLKQMVEAN